jgi:Holliday junction resolvase RusA-like endonuclease
MLYVLQGDPVPLARARHGRHGIYDSQKNTKLIASITIQSQHNNQPLYEGSIHLDIMFYMKIPKMKRNNNLEGCYHVFKPDLSNLIKFVEDLCTSILYHDDSLICSISAAKKYSNEPRTEFEVKIL